MKALAIVQARMGSSRLPGKVLADLAGEPMLARVVLRAARAKTVSEVLIATTTDPADDALEDLCVARGWPCFRGSRDDVLDRYRQAAMSRHAELIVRVTSDCPLLDPALIDRVVKELQQNSPSLDYVCNFLPERTFPRGLDVEAFWYGTLERAWQEDQNQAWREHVSEYILHHPEKFRLGGILNDGDYSNLRWTVDTPEDLELTRLIYSRLGRDQLAWQDVLTVIGAHPQWAEINRHVVQKEVL